MSNTPFIVTNVLLFITFFIVFIYGIVNINDKNCPDTDYVECFGVCIHRDFEYEKMVINAFTNYKYCLNHTLGECDGKCVLPPAIKGNLCKNYKYDIMVTIGATGMINEILILFSMCVCLSTYQRGVETH